ncbi:DNA translocase FtsK [Candidatus Parcubacteria bacterium]|uniref:Cell division protein FtsK n=1 Tax=Candidatus Kaiserbacteria bacterium CG10_big_fil_rev_8_21_14_0_10_47_16 TaxID=1974608 RepID=A0A2H0UEL3_9BACT|nr:DNA translocase FtsK [Candidatus Parcubacteria bacterium]PIR84831.1 MAG: cell division protein FtsK [Candidatus Kaiserbacteria bacterium CG10_big_fil_rev_8_21_14_0_10_47_16]
MARTRKHKKQDRPFFDDLSPHTKQAIGAVLFAVLGTFFILSSLGYAGPAGNLTHRALNYLFGYGFVLAPVICLLYVYVLMRPRDDERVSLAKIIGVALLFFSSLGLFSLAGEQAGGIAGMALEAPLTFLLGGITTGIILAAFALIAIFLTFDIGLGSPFAFLKREDATEEDDDDIAALESELSQVVDDASDSEAEEPEEEVTPRKKLGERMGLRKSGDFMVTSFVGSYAPPPLSLLKKDRGKAQVGDVKANANIIKRTLKNFGIDVEMDEVSIGPTVTRYALKPAEGVRISKIVGLQNNLELALAASPVRIEAPIPGKSLVGIEVPNITKATVGLAPLLTSPDYTDSPKPLLVALGRDITGRAHFANVAKMPHVLIAGTTGSGKSATIHALVVSLLFRNSPEQLRFIMIDPKRVELTLYNDIPHLLTPVITEAKKAILSLKWAIKEMERRYDILQADKVRDIGSYHENIYNPAKAKFEKNGSPEEDKDALPEPLPHIVIVMDELADLMQAYPRELEASIVRLAQMSRAVGIHLILATQRPSVNVITGLIKANVPSRIALQVASQVDSRTILDQVGAEKLLGAGDMLFLSGELAKPQRLQSAFISEEELKDVVNYLKDQSEAQVLDAIDLDADNKHGGDAFFGAMVDDEDGDDLYEDARIAVIEAGKASTSYIQRKLRVGYSRAARLMDLLEERGVIGPADGSKPREIIDQGSSDGMSNDDDE